jgi:hypothetical protein
MCTGVAVSVNCTVCSNLAGSGGAGGPQGDDGPDGSGGGLALGSDSAVMNCIARENVATTDPQISGLPLVTYSCVQDGWPGEGNIDDDPLLVDPNSADYHLQDGSPCINTGDPDGDYSGQTDIDGEPRVQECRVDMGADETPYIGADCQPNGMADACDIADGTSRDFNGNGVPDECECLGDLDYDNDVDLADLAQLLSGYGLTSGAAYEDGDLDGDGDVDLSDLAELLGVYGTSCP